MALGIFGLRLVVLTPLAAAAFAAGVLGGLGAVVSGRLASSRSADHGQYVT
jgi:hypothetical protein